MDTKIIKTKTNIIFSIPVCLIFLLMNIGIKLEAIIINQIAFVALIPFIPISTLIYAGRDPSTIKIYIISVLNKYTLLDCNHSYQCQIAIYLTKHKLTILIF